MNGTILCARESSIRTHLKNVFWPPAFGDKRIYVAGDTENIPEMKQPKDIACAFLPINLPYTMTPEMVADAAKAFKPKVLYPYHYHFGKTDLPKLVELMKDTPKVEIRIRKME